MATTKRRPASAEGSVRHQVGSVTPQERDEVLKLHERRNGLTELVLSLQESPLLANPLFYEKVVGDLGATTMRIAEWWKVKSGKYAWAAAPGGHWSIDFNSCAIFLESQAEDPAP